MNKSILLPLALSFCLTANGQNTVIYGPSNGNTIANGAVKDVTIFGANNARAMQAIKSFKLTIFGNDNMPYSTQNHDNTIMGNMNLFYSTNSSYNSVFGNYIMHNCDTCTANIFAGQGACEYCQGTKNTTGAGIFNARNASRVDRGSFFGYYTDVTSPGLVNASAFGSGALADSSHKIVWGDLGIMSVLSNVSVSVRSDTNVKSNIRYDIPGPEFIDSLKPCTFNYDKGKLYAKYGFAGISNSNDAFFRKRWSGFTFQNVRDAAKKANYDCSALDSNGIVPALRLPDLLPAIVQAEKYLLQRDRINRAKIDSLQQKLATQEAKIDSLYQMFQQQISGLEERVNSIGYRSTPFNPYSELQCTIISSDGKKVFTGKRKDYSYSVPGTYLETFKVAVP